MMTLSPRITRNVSVIAVGMLYTALTFGAAITPTAAEARGKAVYYTAELATPASESRMIANGLVWECEGTRCVAAKGKSRPIVTCTRLSREAGEVTKFTAKGAALADDKLAKCNGK